MSPQLRSMHAASSKFFRGSLSLPQESQPSLSRIDFQPYAWQIASLSSKTEGLPRMEAMKSCRISVDAMRKCLKCKLPAIAKNSDVGTHTFHAAEYTFKDYQRRNGTPARAR